jgi:hypothetical protein
MLAVALRFRREHHGVARLIRLINARLDQQKAPREPYRGLVLVPPPSSRRPFAALNFCGSAIAPRGLGLAMVAAFGEALDCSRSNREQDSFAELGRKAILPSCMRVSRLRAF